MYSFDFTENKFSQCIPNKKAHEWFLAVYPILDKWNINTRVRVAAWLVKLFGKPINRSLAEFISRC